MKDTLGVLLAGGAGERLFPLTRDRAKPAVPFGGNYRISDGPKRSLNCCRIEVDCVAEGVGGAVDANIALSESGK